MTPIVSTTLLRTQSDARLVELARDGHERAFEAIVERYRRPLNRYIRRMLPSARAEDVLQTAFLNAWTSLSTGADIRDLRPWLYRIAHNAAVNTLKRAGYDFEELRESLEGAEGAHADVERQAVMRETLASLAALPERQRKALLETAVEGREPHEVAVEMGMTDNAFRQLVFRARSTMRAAATAVTPMPIALWAAGLGASGSGDVTATRIAELAGGGAGSAGVAASLAKTGAVVVAAGALVAGGTGVVVNGGGGRGSQDQSAAYAAAQTTSTESGTRREAEPGDDRGGARALGDDNRGRTDDRGRGRGRGGSGSGKSGSGRRGGSDDSSGDDNSGKGSGSSGSGSSGSEKSGSSDDGSSGSGSSGSGKSGSSDDSSDDSSSGSGSSGSGSSDSGSSGSGSSGSGSSGSGSSDGGSSGSGRDTSDDSVDSSVSGSGSSGSSTSGSGSSGSGSSGSSGSGSSGSGSSGGGGSDDD